MQVHSSSSVYGTRQDTHQLGTSSSDTHAKVKSTDQIVVSPRTERQVERYRNGFLKRGKSFRETFVINENFNFDGKRQLNQYTITEELGKGSYGHVMKAYNRETKDFWAIKIVEKKKLKKIRVGRFGNALQSVKKELNLWKKLKHRHIVVLREVIDTEGSDELFMVSELLDGGPVLSGEAICTKPLDPMLAKVYFSQLIEGIDFLHSNKIIHRDIKPGNLLLKKDGDGFILKIADFGMSHEMEDADESLRSTAGTAMFSAPEMLTGEKFKGPPIDIWACGVTLYMFIYGRPPFQAITLPELYKKIQNDPIEFPFTVDGQSVDKNVIDLLQNMLEKDPKKRCTIRYIRLHPWAEKEFENTAQAAAATAAVAQQSSNALSKTFATASFLKSYVKRWFKSRSVTVSPSSIVSSRSVDFSVAKSAPDGSNIASSSLNQSQQQSQASQLIVSASEEKTYIHIPTIQPTGPPASPPSRLSFSSVETLDTGNRKSSRMTIPALTTNTGSSEQITIEAPILLTPEPEPVILGLVVTNYTESSTLVEKIEAGITEIQLVS